MKRKEKKINFQSVKSNATEWEIEWIYMRSAAAATATAAKGN